MVDQLQFETDARRSLGPVAERLLQLWTRSLALLPLLAVALLLLVGFNWLAQRLFRWEAPYRRLGVNPFLRSLLRQAVAVAVFLVGLLLALDLIGATPVVTALLGTAGLAGLAIGFAFRDIVENYLAGILMSLRQPFSQGEAIRVGSIEGKVLRLTSRDLVLMGWDGNHLRIPNATVFKSELVNYSRNPLRRFSFRAGIDVGEDLRHAQTLGVEAIASTPGVLADPAPFAVVDELGDYSVIVSFYGWVDQRASDFLRVRSQAIRRVKTALDEAGVLMPEPIQNVRVQQVPEGVRLGEALPARGLPEQRALDRRIAPVEAEAEAAPDDVSLDDQLEEQIQEDLQTSGEENLLGEGPDRAGSGAQAQPGPGAKT